jgi:hypothetical protein
MNTAVLQEILEDHREVVLEAVFGARSGLFDGLPEGTKTIGKAFTTMKNWIRLCYGQSGG